MDKQKELNFLNDLVKDYKDISPYSQIKKDIIINEIKSIIPDSKKSTALQLGCSNGYETDQLSKLFDKLDVIDGSSIFIENLKKVNINKNVNYIFALFEDLLSVCKKKYEFIFCNYVLEHVYDSVEILKILRELLQDDGLLFIVVPNANAFSRNLAKEMNLLNNLIDLTKNDIDHGLRRVYTINSLDKDITEANLKIVKQKGLVFKILADFQLNELLKKEFFTREHILGLHNLANQKGNINYSDSLFVIISK